MKFKVGDPVRVKSWEEAEKVENFVKAMKPLCGKPAVILEIEDGTKYKLRPMKVEDLCFDWDWHFTDEMLTEFGGE